MFDFLKFGTADNTQQRFPVEDDESIDRAIFSLERLQMRAAELASTHRIGIHRKIGFDLLGRLEGNKNELKTAKLNWNTVSPMAGYFFRRGTMSPR